MHLYAFFRKNTVKIFIQDRIIILLTYVHVLHKKTSAFHKMIRCQEAFSHTCLFVSFLVKQLIFWLLYAMKKQENAKKSLISSVT